MKGIFSTQLKIEQCLALKEYSFDLSSRSDQMFIA